MYVRYALFGLLLGVLASGWGIDAPLGALAGTTLGLLYARLRQLELRIRKLESAAQTHGSSISDRELSSSESQDTLTGRAKEPRTEASPPVWADAPETEELRSTAYAPGVASPGEEHRQAPADRPSIVESAIRIATKWLTTGNIPVKVGVIISFVGVSFLLKYAIDRRLLVVPLEVRLLAVAAAALVLLGIGWRLRRKTPVYALSLQGGGLGILFLTVYAAFRIWALLPATLSFVLLVILTVSTGALSVLQNARWLAILGVVGGFLAPILVSTGQGSHVVLFSYYLLLNVAILGIAWYRAWRGLNLLGFAFTFVIGSVWGFEYYKPELWASTQPFLVLHFLLYQAVAILFARRQPPERSGIVDGTLVFGTPVIVFALQAALVNGMEYGLAISSAVAAAFYALGTFWLRRQKAFNPGMFAESYLALAVAFATVTIPLALDARWTSASWALEGAALVWIGVRQDRKLAKLAGTALIGLSGFAFLDHGWQARSGMPVLNGNLLGGLLISVSAFYASKKLSSAVNQGFENAHRIVALGLFVWALAWWMGTGWQESLDRLTLDRQNMGFLLFVSASSAVAVRLARTWEWPMLRHAALLNLVLMGLLAARQFSPIRHFLAGLGWLAWPFAWAVQGMVLRALDEFEESTAAFWHFASVMMLAVMLSIEAWWWTGGIASDAWAIAAASVVAGTTALLTWRLRDRPQWPVPAHPATYLLASVALVAGQVVYLAAFSVRMPGSPDPLPYIPVFNPFDLAMLFSMFTAARSVTAIRRYADEKTADPEVLSALDLYVPPYRLLLAVLFFVLTTAALIRSVHHFAAVPWDFDSMFRSVVAQTALSIYWGVLGFAGMIFGARRRRRPVWLAGAGFMALVVLKLFLIDLGNTGTVERIISFIGIGVLLLVVGYFAPAPPRNGNPDTVSGA